MKFDIAVIKSDKSNYDLKKKICGLFLLERNIRILNFVGIKKIYLDLSKEERLFYLKMIKRHLKGLKDTEIIESFNGKILSHHISLPTNIFIQAHYFSNYNEYFTEIENTIVPIIKEDQFLLIRDIEYRKATKLIKENIIKNTGGFIAQKINKRISIPISLLLAQTRIHPNILTFFNMIIGLFSAVFVLYNTYWYVVLGGLFFQLASIIDGVDGEVAKLTLKVSKIGSWLDTISDNLTHLSFLAAISYINIINIGGIITLIFIILIFISSSIILFIIINYLKNYSDSGSLNAYDREFLQSLPQDDPIILFINKMKYFLKKEFFALLFFIICLTGETLLIIMSTAIVTTFGSIALISVKFKYFNNYKYTNS